MFEQLIDIERVEQLIGLFGNFDENVKRLEKEYNVNITSHGGQIKVTGETDNVLKACKALNCLISMINKGETVNSQSVELVIGMVDDGDDDKISSITDADCICVSSKGRPVKPKTLGQKRYVEAIKNNTITVGVGPAGTGKTYLAVAQAVNAFRSKQVNRIILTRPAVEAGERLGFLPGDLQQKIDPYLRPLYDALFDMLGAENFQKCQERGDIEVAPLAYMRGRTLDDSFIILDEAQNTTSSQIKMFMTRMGQNTKMIITGDRTQIDLPPSQRSGLIEALRILQGVEGIAFVQLDKADIVRHKLAALRYAPFYAYLVDGLVVLGLHHLLYQRSRKVDIEHLRNHLQVSQFSQRLYGRYYRYVYAGCPASFLPVEEFLIVEKHLCHNEFGACVYLLLQVLHVDFGIWRFYVFLRISGL